MVAYSELESMEAYSAQPPISDLAPQPLGLGPSSLFIECTEGGVTPLYINRLNISKGVPPPPCTLLWHLACSENKKSKCQKWPRGHV